MVIQDIQHIQRARLSSATDDVIYFRTLDDYQRLHALADRKAEFVVIGGGMHRRVEREGNANTTGAMAGRNMAGASEKYESAEALVARDGKSWLTPSIPASVMARAATDRHR